MEPGLKNWLRLISLGIIWGASFMAVSVAVKTVGPLSVAAWRIGIGAVLLLILIRIRNIPLPRLNAENGKTIWAFATGFGFFSMALPFFLLSWGQQHVASGFAGVTMATVPILVLPLAHFLVPGEIMSRAKLIGVFLGLTGVAILIGPDAFQSLGGRLEPIARLACFGAAACYAFGNITTRLAPAVDHMAFATAATTMAALMIIPLAISIEGFTLVTDGNALISIIFLGAIPTALANLLLVAVVRSAGPSFTSLVNYQVPLWSVLFGAVFLHELLPTRTFAALALIMVGVGFSQQATLRRLLGRSVDRA